MIGVQLADVSARCVVAPTSMIRRLRPGVKANKGDGTTTTHTAYDDQSETDSQSQFSEETNTAPHVPSSKGKAQVCTDKDCQRSSSEQLQNQRHFYSKTRFLFPLGILCDYHHMKLLSGSVLTHLTRGFSGHRFGAYIRRALKFTRHTWPFCRLSRRL